MDLLLHLLKRSKYNMKLHTSDSVPVTSYCAAWLALRFAIANLPVSSRIVLTETILSSQSSKASYVNKMI